MDGKDVVHIYIIVVHIYNIRQYYSAEIKKKKSSNAICNNMNAIRDYHPKWSKPEKER